MVLGGVDGMNGLRLHEETGLGVFDEIKNRLATRFPYSLRKHLCYLCGDFWQSCRFALRATFDELMNFAMEQFSGLASLVHTQSLAGCITTYTLVKPNEGAGYNLRLHRWRPQASP